MATRSYLTTLLILLLVTSSRAQSTPAPVEPSTLGKTRNVHVCDGLYLAGQPTEADIAVLAKRGIKRVITLRADGEISWPEARRVESAGLEFVAVPVASADALTPQLFARIRRLLRDADSTPTLLHCASANRVGAVWVAHRVLDEQVPMDVAWKEAKKIGLRSKALEGKVIEYIESQQSRPESSIRPGINDRFMSGELDVSEWLGRFEVESREVFSSQKEVLDAIGLAPGSRVADIGAGTGFFARLFSEAVGDEGWVFAVDIAPSFITHIRQKSQDSRLTNLSPVLCSERSIDLPPKSIDVAFSSDTYHHFEYPQTTLSSIHRALRDGGTMVVVDFERIPGESREFILGHVRAGKKQVRGEIEAAGFEFVEEVMVSGFKENYFLRFKKR